MSIFLSDSFPGSGALTSHLTDQGDSWVLAASLYGNHHVTRHLDVAGGSVQLDHIAGYSGAVPTVAPPSADYYVKAVVHKLNNTDNVVVGLRWVFGGSDPSGYFVDIQSINQVLFPNGIDIGLWSAVGVVQTELDPGGGPYQTFTVADDENFTIEVRAVGSLISIYLDTVLVYSVVDTSCTAAGLPHFFFLGSLSALTDVGISYFEAGTLASGPFWTDYVRTAET